MKLHHITLVALVGGLLVACASTSETGDKPKGIAAFADDVRLGEEVSKICFNRNIDGFSSATRDTVVLSAGPSKDYIVEVNACHNLRFAQLVAIDSSLSCVTRSDILLVSESAFSLDDGKGMGPDRCFIKKIHKWDKRAKKDAEIDSDKDDKS